MKILLLNDNPVVNKLVTLSAQKTSDELEVAENADNINEGDYDLLIVDDTLYEDTLLETLKEKINFMQSLYICSRDAKQADEFSKMIKKPFLPTDLVDLFSSIGKEVLENDTATETLEEINLDDEEIVELDTLSLDDDVSLDEEILELDKLEALDEGVLDKDDLQEVQNLLESSDLSDLDEEIDLDSLDLKEDDLEEEDVNIDDALEELDVDIDDEVVAPEEDLGMDDLDEDDLEEALNLEIEEEDEKLDEDLDLSEDLEEETLAEEDESTSLEEELLEEDEEIVSEELLEEQSLEPEIEEDEEIASEELLEEQSLESEIEQAVSELSQEDLESEIDESTLLDIAKVEIDGLDTLSTRDLKIAVGEEVEEENDTIAEMDVEIDSDNDGVESLKKLLEALSNKDVAASMKGMKISINIELGGS